MKSVKLSLEVDYSKERSDHQTAELLPKNKPLALSEEHYIQSDFFHRQKQNRLLHWKQ